MYRWGGGYSKLQGQNTPTVTVMLFSSLTSKGRWALWSQSKEANSSQTGDGDEICGDTEETVRNIKPCKVSMKYKILILY